MRFSWLCFLVLLSGGACADFHRGPVSDASRNSAPVLVDDPEFEEYVYPILQNLCETCHSQGKEAGGTHFIMTGNPKRDRAAVVKLVSPHNPVGSLFLRRAIGESHSGGQRLTIDGPEYQIISTWIMVLPLTP
jgi:hypothetical protein